MTWQKYGLNHYGKITARLGIMDDDKFLDKYSNDHDFNRMVRILEDEYSRRESIKDLKKKIKELERKNCCCCHCCGGCCK